MNFCLENLDLDNIDGKGQKCVLDIMHVNIPLMVKLLTWEEPQVICIDNA